jgi:hypothetical protein
VQLHFFLVKQHSPRLFKVEIPSLNIDIASGTRSILPPHSISKLLSKPISFDAISLTRSSSQIPHASCCGKPKALQDCNCKEPGRSTASAKPPARFAMRPPPLPSLLLLLVLLPSPPAVEAAAGPASSWAALRAAAGRRAASPVAQEGAAAGVLRRLLPSHALSFRFQIDPKVGARNPGDEISLSLVLLIRITSCRFAFIAPGRRLWRIELLQDKQCGWLRQRRS